MAAGGGDFERAFGAFLTLDVGEVGRGVGDFKDSRLRPRQHLRAFEVIGELDQRCRRDDFDFGAGPGRLGAAFGRADQAFTAGIGADRGRQDAGDRRDRAIKAKLAEHGEAGQCVVGNGTDRGHQAERNRQIIVAAFLR